MLICKNPRLNPGVALRKPKVTPENRVLIYCCSVMERAHSWKYFEKFIRQYFLCRIPELSCRLYAALVHIACA